MAVDQVEVVVDDITQVKGVLTEYDSVAAGIAELKSKYSGVIFPDLNTVKGMDAALKARQEIRAPRYAVQKILDRAKKPLNDLKNRISARAAEITTELLAIEEPIDAQIKAEEARKEAARVERERAETARIAVITDKIAAIRNIPATLVAASADDLRAAITSLQNTVITDDEFQEWADTARQALLGTIETVAGMVEAAVQRAVEAADLERQRQELAKAQAEAREQAAKEAAERAAAKAAADAAAKAAKAAEDERIRAERKALAEERQRVQEAEARVAAAQKLLDDAKAAAEAEAKRIKDAAEAREKARKEERMDEALAAAFPFALARFAILFQALSRSGKAWLTQIIIQGLETLVESLDLDVDSETPEAVATAKETLAMVKRAVSDYEGPKQ